MRKIVWLHREAKDPTYHGGPRCSYAFCRKCSPSYRLHSSRNPNTRWIIRLCAKQFERIMPKRLHMKPGDPPKTFIVK